MAKIDLEKVLIALLDSPFNKQFNDKVKKALKEQGLEYKDGKIVEIQKPKFKVGDWVVISTLDGRKIVQVVSIEYFPSGQPRYVTSECKWFGNGTEAHLWDITKDAEDGDVLQLGKVTAIFQEYIDNGYCKCYCSVCDGAFEIPIEDGEDDIYGCTNTTPATKEQRDLLFQKMKEAGYEWDSDKKELKKVDKTKDLSNYIKFLKTFHCWSKEQREIMDKYLEEQIKKDYSPIDSRFDYEHANIQQKDYSPEEDEELFFGDFRKTDSEDKGKASFTNRQVYNQAILRILSNYIKKYPDIRFGQMLCNLGVKPYFDQESREAYWNLCKTINKQK